MRCFLYDMRIELLTLKGNQIYLWIRFIDLERFIQLLAYCMLMLLCEMLLAWEINYVVHNCYCYVRWYFILFNRNIEDFVLYYTSFYFWILRKHTSKIYLQNIYIFLTWYSSKPFHTFTVYSNAYNITLKNSLMLYSLSSLSFVYRSVF